MGCVRGVYETALIPLPLLIGGALWYPTTAHSRYRRQRRAASAMNAQLMDNLQGIRQIKAFGREKHEDRRFSEKAEELRQGTLSVMRAWAVYSPGLKRSCWRGQYLFLCTGLPWVMDHTKSWLLLSTKADDQLIS
mgnify:CR=1 FL=1